MKTFLLSIALFLAVGLSAQTVTIYEIQGQTGISPYESQIVTTSGIITTLARDDGFYLQDGEGAWNGVYVYPADSSFLEGLNRGDEVEIVVKVSEYYEKTELTDMVSLNVLSTGNDIPAATVLATGDVADEQYEGVLITVENAVCTDTTIGYGEFLVTDGSGTCRIDDKLWSLWLDMTPTPDSIYNVTGVVDYSFDNYKLLPRDAEDLILSSSASVNDNENINLEIYPNPVTNGILNISTEEMIDNVIVFNMIGQKVFVKGEVREFNSQINLDNLDKGVYILQINTTKGNATTRRIMID